MLKAPDQTTHIYMTKTKGFKKGILVFSHQEPNNEHYRHIDTKQIEISH